MFAAKKEPSNKQLKEADITALNAALAEYHECLKKLSAINRTLIQIIALSGLTLCQTPWSFIAIVSGYIGYQEIAHAPLRQLLQKRSELDHAYQQQLAKLLCCYKALRDTYGKDVTYDEKFIELTKVIIDLVTIQDLLGKDLSLNKTFNTIFSQSRHKQTFVDTKNNTIPALRKEGQLEQQPQSYPDKMFSLFASGYATYNYGLYGLKDHYRCMIPKPEDPAIQGSENVLATVLGMANSLKSLLALK